ncbi:hypothetical protein GXW74_06625 [Roseomonas eburnea]|uniref:Uncharacterized protein n=1 Tax=Neoroseomonas eburnea TaxID=1346889 RepID=A0A9X9X8W8_9PROT|nr:hypothetical protein [Neoroseomonas eburnea]MBR0680154.1 hypothetical protein [Neoroseomonas eburnea]
MRPLPRLLTATLCVAPAACGIVWDDGTGRRHALGIGHVSWPVPPADRPATVSGVDVAGVAVLATTISSGIVVGMARERSVHLGDEQLLSLDCLDCDLADARPRGGAAREGTEP